MESYKSHAACRVYGTLISFTLQVRSDIFAVCGNLSTSVCHFTKSGMAEWREKKHQNSEFTKPRIIKAD